MRKNAVRPLPSYLTKSDAEIAMKLNKWAVVAGLGLALSLGANNSLAQQFGTTG